MKDFYTGINLHENPLQFAVIHPLAAAPGSPTEGQIYYNNVSNSLFFYDGSTWVDASHDDDAVPKDTIFFNVKDHGAAGDGVADDTAEIAAAIAAADAAGGGTVYFPAGTYNISVQLALPEGVNVYGAGRHAVTINQLTSGQRGFSLTNGTGETIAELFMAGFRLVGTNSGSADGVFIEGRPLDYLSLMDITVADFGGTGVRTKGAIVSRLEGVIGQGCNVNGIWIDGSDSFVTSVSLIGCYGNANTVAGVKISKATYVALMGGAADSNQIGHHFLDCFALTATGTGSESNSVNSFKVEGSGDFGSNGVNLVGCYSYDVGEVGFLITGFAVGVQLIGCHDNDPDVGADYSVQVDANAVASSYGSTFSNPNNIVGVFTNLADELGNSTLRNVELIRLRDLNGNLILEAITGNVNAVNGFGITNSATGVAPLIGPAGTDTNIPGYYTSKGNGDIRLALDDGTVLLNIDGENSDNVFYMTPSATGQAPLFGVTGVDTDIPLYLQSKGNGDVRLAHLGGDLIANFSAVDATPVNYPAFTAVNTGQAVSFGVAGADADIYLNLESKGTGTVRANGVDIATATNALAMTNKSFPNGVIIPGTSGQMSITADPDGGDYNIGVDTTGNLAFYGSGGNVLSIDMLDGDINFSDSTRGIILTAPNTTRYRVTVSNAGALVVTAI
jgi:hypothetical protein